MRTYVLLCTILVAIYAVHADHADFHEALKKYSEECFEEHGVEKADVEKLKEEHYKGMSSADVPENIKCGFHCITMRAGFTDPSGHINHDAVVDLLNEEEIDNFEAAYKECNELSGKNECDTAAKIFECMMEHKQKRK